MSMLDKLLNTDPEVTKMKREERDARIQERKEAVKKRQEENKRRREQMQKERAQKQGKRRSPNKPEDVETHSVNEDATTIKEASVEEKPNIEEIKYITPRTRR